MREGGGVDGLAGEVRYKGGVRRAGVDETGFGVKRGGAISTWRSPDLIVVDT